MIDKIHDIDINEKEIKDYLPEIFNKLEGLDREELIKRFVSIEFNQFLSYYENSRDLNSDDSKDRDRSRSSDDSFTRFYINIGKMDDLNPARLIGFINENLEKKDVEIGQIEILKSFSFFEIDKNYSVDVLEKLKDSEFNNRNIIVEVTTKPKSRGRNRGRRNFGGSDNFRGNRDRKRGDNDGGRSERRGNRERDFSGGGERRKDSGRRRRN